MIHQEKTNKTAVFNCTLCHAPTSLWTTKKDYEIYQCAHCGFAQVRPSVSIDLIKKIYAVSGHDTPNIKRETKTLDDVYEQERIYPNAVLDAQRLSKNAVRFWQGKALILLDIGAGYGFFTKAFIEKGFKIAAIELADQEARLFYEMNKFKPQRVVFEEFQGAPETFSHILMSQILEHVIDPIDWVERSHTLLKPNGILMIALPNFNSFFRKVMQAKEPFITPPYHLNYFTKQSLSALLESKGFEVIHYQTITRLPFPKIFGKMGIPAFLIPVCSFFGKGVLKCIDAFNYGSILNIYARKKP
jgi:2-polyprenyl-3-methyl-5-hydroxy-6-metoxy-1,4-benzoquinol methylase